jgi:ribosomal protein S27E
MKNEVKENKTIENYKDCSKMLGWLKYQSDPAKNKKGTPEQISMASSALQVRCFICTNENIVYALNALFVSCSIYSFCYS